jgi:type IV secretion system protein TrbL
MRPFAINKTIRYIVLAGIVLLVIQGLGFAQSTGNTFTMTEPSTMLDAYEKGTKQWVGTLTIYANRIFTLLLLVEFTYSAITQYLQHQELQSWMAAMVRKIFSLSAFYVLLVKGPDWIPTIIDSLQVIGQSVGAGALAPDTILGHGFNISMDLLTGAKAQGFFANTVLALLMCVSALVVLFAYILVTIQFIIAKVETYIFVSAGIIFLGFGASRWTSSYTERYIAGTVASGIKLMMLYLIIALGDPLSKSWINQASQIGDAGFENGVTVSFSVMTGVLVFAVICWTTPKIVSGLISGSPSLSGGDLAGAALFGASVPIGAAAIAAGPGLFSGGGGSDSKEKNSSSGGPQVQSPSQAAGNASTFQGIGGGDSSASRATSPPLLPSFTEGSSQSSGGQVAPPALALADSFQGQSAPSASDSPSASSSENGAAHSGGGVGSSTGSVSGANTSHPGKSPTTASSEGSSASANSTGPPESESTTGSTPGSLSGGGSVPASGSSPIPALSTSEPDNAVSAPGSTSSNASDLPIEMSAPTDGPSEGTAPNQSGSGPPNATGDTSSNQAPSEPASSAESASAAPSSGAGDGEKKDESSKKPTVGDFLNNLRHHVSQTHLPHDGGGGGAAPSMNIKHDE